MAHAGVCQTYAAAHEEARHAQGDVGEHRRLGIVPRENLPESTTAVPVFPLAILDDVVVHGPVHCTCDPGLAEVDLHLSV